MMKYSSYISFIWKNPVAQFLYRKTEKPILSIMDWCGQHVVVTVLILLVIGMGLRIGYRGMVDRPDRDEITYISWVEEASEQNHVSSPEMQHILIYAGVLMDKLGIDIEWGLRCFNLICSLLWLCMIYILGQTVFNSPRIGLICLTLAVFNPYTIRLAGQVMREPFYLLLFSVALFCAIQIIRDTGTMRFSILLGILPVLGVFCRYEAFELLLLMPLAVFFRLMARKTSHQIFRWRPLALAVVLYMGALGITVIGFCWLFPLKTQYIKNCISKAIESIL